MKLSAIKEKMLQHKDYLGFDFSEYDLIKNANSKRQLKCVISNHRKWLEMLFSDVLKDLDEFEKTIGLEYVEMDQFPNLKETTVSIKFTKMSPDLTTEFL